MKTLGMIGGLGPESTIDYYRRIITLYRERNRNGSYPQFIIDSVDLKKGRDLITANDLVGVGKYLLAEIHKLARAGAHFGLIAANTPHIVFDDIARVSPLPLISIVEATCQAAKAGRFKNLALFGTSFTMQGTFYPKVFSKEGINLVIPEPANQHYINDKYFNELVAGKFLPETRAGLLAIVDVMKAKNDIDGVILAGTELPLILPELAHEGVPFLDTTKIHCEAAVAEMFS
jgi:aspartate racemase